MSIVLRLRGKAEAAFLAELAHEAALDRRRGEASLQMRRDRRDAAWRFSLARLRNEQAACRRIERRLLTAIHAASRMARARVR